MHSTLIKPDWQCQRRVLGKRGWWHGFATRTWPSCSRGLPLAVPQWSVENRAIMPRCPEPLDCQLGDGFLDVPSIWLLLHYWPLGGRSGGSRTKSRSLSSRTQSTPLPATSALVAPLIVFHLWRLTWSSPFVLPSCLASLVARSTCTPAVPEVFDNRKSSEANAAFSWPIRRRSSSRSKMSSLTSYETEACWAALADTRSRCWINGKRSLKATDVSNIRTKRRQIPTIAENAPFYRGSLSSAMDSPQYRPGHDGAFKNVVPQFKSGLCFE